MKLRSLLALSFVLSLSAAAQTDAMPAEHNATAQHGHKKMGPPSTELKITIGSGAPVTLHLADLQALPQQTLTARNGHSKTDETYTGPALADVLAKAGLVLTDKTEHDLLRLILVAKGTDNYWVAYSVAEVEPGFNSSKVIVALTRDGAALTTTGQFELINSADKKPARWLHNLASIVVKSAE